MGAGLIHATNKCYKTWITCVIHNTGFPKDLRIFMCLNVRNHVRGYSKLSVTLSIGHLNRFECCREICHIFAEHISNAPTFTIKLKTNFQTECLLVNVCMYLIRNLTRDLLPKSYCLLWEVSFNKTCPCVSKRFKLKRADIIDGDQTALKWDLFYSFKAVFYSSTLTHAVDTVCIFYFLSHQWVQ